VDDMDHVWGFLERLCDTPDPNYQKLIASRLKGFKHWNPGKIGLLRKRVDRAHAQANGLQVDIRDFTLDRHNLWLGILAEAQKHLI
jgi:hypothetical protein